MPGQRRQFPRVGRLVQREQDEGKPSLVAVAIEQRPQCVNVFDRRRNIRALVAPELPEDSLVMVPNAARVKLHDEPVLNAHPGHLGQHLRAKELRIRRACTAAVYPRIKLLRLARGKVCRLGAWMAVIGRRRTHLLEEHTPLPQCRQIARPGRNILAGNFGQPPQIALELRHLGVDHTIWSKRGNHPPRPARVADRLVPLKRIGRGIRRRQHLNSEPLKERPRQKLRRLKLLRDGLVISVRVCLRETFGQAEEVDEDKIQPHPRRRPAKQKVVLREDPPDLPGIDCGRSGRVPVRTALRDTQRFKRNTLRIQHAKDVMIGLNQQRCRVRKRLVLGKPARIRMPVRRNDRQVAHRLIKP